MSQDKRRWHSHEGDGHGGECPPPDPPEADATRVFESNRSEYGARRMKSRLVDERKVVSRRRIGYIMRKNGLTSAYGAGRFRQPRSEADCADVPNVLDRRFSGRAPHTHVASGLAYVRVGGRWDHVCLLADMANREIAGRSAGEHEDAGLVMASSRRRAFLYMTRRSITPTGEVSSTATG
jgi:hypothetical protein